MAESCQTRRLTHEMDAERVAPVCILPSPLVAATSGALWERLLRRNSASRSTRPDAHWAQPVSVIPRGGEELTLTGSGAGAIGRGAGGVRG